MVTTHTSPERGGEPPPSGGGGGVGVGNKLENIKISFRGNFIELRLNIFLKRTGDV